MKGIRKVHQPKKQYTLRVEELIEMLDEYHALQRETDQKDLLQNRRSNGNNGSSDAHAKKDS
jgi:hypothetical protein